MAKEEKEKSWNTFMAGCYTEDKLLHTEVRIGSARDAVLVTIEQDAAEPDRPGAKDTVVMTRAQFLHIAEQLKGH